MSEAKPRIVLLDTGGKAPVYDIGRSIVDLLRSTLNTVLEVPFISNRIIIPDSNRWSRKVVETADWMDHKFIVGANVHYVEEVRSAERIVGVDNVLTMHIKLYDENVLKSALFEERCEHYMFICKHAWNAALTHNAVAKIMLWANNEQRPAQRVLPPFVADPAH